MRRAIWHVGFGLAATVSATVLALQLVELERAEEDNGALAAVPATLSHAEAVGTNGTGAGKAAGTGGVVANSTGVPLPELPRARLAFASALAAGGDVDAAETLLAGLVRRHGDDPVGRDARFALANRYLREGADEDLDPRLARPLLELAKQRYRDILRATPDDWDVRYNLERALRLAPERSVRGEEDREVVKRVDVIVPDFEPKDLP